ncbi:MAG: transcription termination factor NusA [Candidatus Magnetobacterium sp. LHC-1]|uniref:Transcription termination/antitermination protein NusA n=1 Tax=Candidatus Magnetobacterium casense TaxID=1455061 RepID=A0ABS6S2B6_9BACT|nr:transcription termination factor NusA [Candidatus Magnetobacterium casensis]MBF0606644.1 transcription termination/antitermination protein NusA [Nitrospirota bacterium]MBV6342980.1 transcription termination/antitermination protein NusA [Candidatus Magnetobacterium casensis]
MSKELRYVIEQLSHEKGISKAQLRTTIESAMLTALKKKFIRSENVGLFINPDNYEIAAYKIKTVVDQVSDKHTEIALSDALLLSDKVAVGDTIKEPLDIKDFGRIAAQTAKQVILQKVREAERDVIYDKFITKVGTIASGTVLRREKGMYYIGIGKTEAILPVKETIHREHLKVGDTVRAYISEVVITSKGPQIMLSRTSTDFVVELFRMEVPEIGDNIVIIKGVVREPGERTKLAVFCKDTSIDPVGACVGMKGTRVQTIVRELRGERIDIILWSPDPRIYISRALTPSEVDKIGVNEEDKTAMAVVEDSQLSIAIGKKGQNVKLAMKLTGWDIDIISESRYTKMRQEKAVDDIFHEKRKG